MKFLVYRVYYIHRGGDNRFWENELIGILEADSLEKAEKWAKDNSHNHISSTPYEDTDDGNLKVEPMKLPILTLSDCPWSKEDLEQFKEPVTRFYEENGCEEDYEEEGYDAMPYWYDEAYEDE